MAEPLTPEVARALGRLNDFLSTLPVGTGRSQALVDVNVILTAARAAAPLDVERLRLALNDYFGIADSFTENDAAMVANIYTRLSEYARRG